VEAERRRKLFFFLIFFAHLKLIIGSIFLAKFHGGFGAEEEVVLFLNFLCTFETHNWFNFSCKVSWRIRFADTAFTSFSIVKSLFLHLVFVLLSVCKI